MGSKRAFIKDGKYGKRWSPRHAVLCRMSVRKLDKAVETRTRREGKNETQLF
jgi:hypothetical protein